jgi:glycogen operon protein
MSGRRPWASVNLVTAHDGFTLRDLVSYERKQNADNGEANRDGTDDNRSQNFGVEGETNEPAVLADRMRTARALLSTLLLSAGTPMLTAGDERWRTQRGNNNAYCQDNVISWLDWSPDPDAEALTAFTARLVALRKDGRPPSWERFYRPEDVTWWRTDGGRITEQNWHDTGIRTVGMLSGKEWMLVLHSGAEPIEFVLPDVPLTPVLDSSRPDGQPTDEAPLAPAATITVPGHTVLLLTAD